MQWGRLAMSAYLRAYIKAAATNKQYRPHLSDRTFYIRELFAKTRWNDESEQARRSSEDDPSDFKTTAPPSHYGPTSITHPMILTQTDENQAGASGSIASSMHRPDIPSLFSLLKVTSPTTIEDDARYHPTRGSRQGTRMGHPRTLS